MLQVAIPDRKPAPVPVSAPAPAPAPAATFDPGFLDFVSKLKGFLEVAERLPNAIQMSDAILQLQIKVGKLEEQLEVLAGPAPVTG